ncbi:hypothetical protein R5R35_000685 [Gryllus longicercus]|uniref:Uncharacterized protein n=1 Tax=Gryllus longicercus TaxID=2509291 RepID=A0AAN9VX24_9ORTH
MLVLKEEHKEKIRIEKRNREINERCRRIHNPRWTLMGIDKKALDKQVQERKEKEEMERTSKEMYEKYWLQNLQKALDLERNEEKAKRFIEKDLEEFRRVQQAPHMRLSFDLNDPNWLKKQKLVNMDDHHIVGPSAILKFDGEDCNKYQRSKIQIEQNRAWLDQQVIEKWKKEEETRAADECYLQEMCNIQEMLCDKMKKEQEDKMRMHQEISEVNRKLAEEKAARERAERCAKPDGDGYTMYTHLGPALSDEPPRAGKKVSATMYKGLTEEQKAEYRRSLEQQIADLMKQKELECRSESEWDKHFVAVYREALLCARAEERKRRELRRKIMEENKKLAEEQAIRREIDKKRARAPIGCEFFNQFEKCP